MPADPHAPPERPAYQPPKDNFHNNPFADDAFLLRAEEALAKDRAAEKLAPVQADPPAEQHPAAEAKAPETKQPEVKAPETKQDAVPEVKVDLNQKKETPSAKAFAEQRKRIAELEKKLAEAPAAVQQPDMTEFNKQYEQVKKQNEDLSEKLMVVGIERHDKFKAEVTAPFEQTIATARGVVAEELADRVETALRMPIGKSRDKIFEEINESLTPRQQSVVNLMDIESQKIMRRRDEMLAKPKELWAQIEARTKAEQQEAMEHENKIIRGAFDTAMQKAISPEEGLFVFQEKEGDSTWNNSVKQRRDLAAAIFNNTLSPEQRARASLWSAAAPELATQLESLAKENADLKAQVGKMTATTPKVDGGGAEANPNDNVRYNSDRPYVDQLSERASKVFDR